MIGETWMALDHARKVGLPEHLKTDPDVETLFATAGCNTPEENERIGRACQKMISWYRSVR